MTEAGADKRAQPRKRVLKAGKIVFSNGNFVVDCIIDNLSDGGAHIRVDTNTLLPKEFHLYEPHRSMVHKATIVRRTPKGLGLRFDGQVEDPAIRETYMRKWNK